MNWHVDPERYEPVPCSYCTPEGRDPNYPAYPCPLCHGRKRVDPDYAPAPEPGFTED